MANEPIYARRRHGFPKRSEDENGITNTIEYVDEFSALDSAKPDIGEEWGEYEGFVISSEIEEFEGTTYSILTVVCSYEYEVDPETPGVEGEVSPEIEWVCFERSMYEHPEFAIGGSGTYRLSESDIADIKNWENEIDPEFKSTFRYAKRDSNGNFIEYVDLSEEATKFAEGINLGQTSWEDYAPVIRQTTEYRGGPPISTTAGLKDNPPEQILGKPTNGTVPYEWRKTADRSIRAGNKRRWQRTEEWIGAVKILSDRENIYW